MKKFIYMFIFLLFLGIVYWADSVFKNLHWFNLNNLSYIYTGFQIEKNLINDIVKFKWNYKEWSQLNALNSYVIYNTWYDYLIYVYGDINNKKYKKITKKDNEYMNDIKNKWLYPKVNLYVDIKNNKKSLDVLYSWNILNIYWPNFSSYHHIKNAEFIKNSKWDIVWIWYYNLAWQFNPWDLIYSLFGLSKDWKNFIEMEYLVYTWDDLYNMASDNISKQLDDILKKHVISNDKIQKNIKILKTILTKEEIQQDQTTISKQPEKTIKKNLNKKKK